MTVLQDEDRQHDPVQREEETLEEDEAEAVDQPCGSATSRLRSSNQHSGLSRIGIYSFLQCFLLME